MTEDEKSINKITSDIIEHAEKFLVHPDQYARWYGTFLDVGMEIGRRAVALQRTAKSICTEDRR